jgi:hypothetical protein
MAVYSAVRSTGRQPPGAHDILLKKESKVKKVYTIKKTNEISTIYGFWAGCSGSKRDRLSRFLAHFLERGAKESKRNF